VQTRQLTIPYIRRVLIIVDGARGVKIVSRVRYRRITEVVCIRCRTAGALCDIVITSHMIEHYVDVNPYAGVVTPANHLLKFVRRARPRLPDIRYRLVTFPPWSIAYDHILLDRRNLRQFNNLGILIYLMIHMDQ